MEGVVPVGGSTSVAITVENWKEQAATGQHVYHVQDLESAEPPQKLIVALAGQRQAMFERRESFKTQPTLEPVEKPPPLLTVR